MAPPTRRQVLYASFNTALTILSENDPAYDPPLRSRLSNLAAALHTSAVAHLAAISKKSPPHNTKLVCVSIAIISLGMKWLTSSTNNSNRTQHHILQSMHHQQVDDLITQFLAIDSCRYLTAQLPRGRREWCSDRFRILFNEPEPVFMRLARMQKSSFIRLLHMIGDHAVFENSSNMPQAVVEWQLLVALAYLGLTGNGASPVLLALGFGISEGSVYNYTNRCVIAIVSLNQQFFGWPDAMRRRKIKEAVAKKSFFKGCVGFIDGTLINLHTGPEKNMEDFRTRKSTYAVNSMLVCDHEKHIIYASHGWCGSAHDSRVYRNTQLAQHPEQFFAPGEYLIGDSGYPSTKYLVTNFKKPRGMPLPPLQRSFNKELSRLRYVIENTNWLWKGRWQSLFQNRIIIKGFPSARRLNLLLSATVVLHNFLIDVQDRGNDLFQAPHEHDEDLVDDEEEIHMDDDELQPDENNTRAALFAIYERTH